MTEENVRLSANDIFSELKKLEIRNALHLDLGNISLHYTRIPGGYILQVVKDSIDEVFFIDNKELTGGPK